MQTYGSAIPGGPALAQMLPKAASQPRERPPFARRRLLVVAGTRLHGKSLSLTTRHFGLSRSTVYDWLRRYEPNGLLGLEDHSRRPRNLPQPTWSSEVEKLSWLDETHTLA
jgi:transposase